jgi:hypothetical protein
MDTLRVDICYRPIRIAWAIEAGDRASFQTAVRLSHTMQGGRFNPIVTVDHPDANDIIECFRADLVVPVPDIDAIKKSVDRYPHLRTPFFPDRLFLRDPGRPTLAHVLDIHNGLVHWRDAPNWKGLTEHGFRTFSWDDDDPLADVFLMQLGAYPSKGEIGTDYRKFVSDALLPHPLVDIKIDRAAPIPIETTRFPSIGYLARFGLQRHYSIDLRSDYPGFYIGDSKNLDDLICFWNLRAADITLQFIDPQHLSRYALVRPEYAQHLTEELSHFEEHRRRIAVWGRGDRCNEGVALYPNGGLIICPIGDRAWRSFRAPMMILGEESSLGVVSEKAGRPGVSFSFKEKPFSGQKWFYTQYLVASLSFIGGWSIDGKHSFRPPYVPELNEFFARSMGVPYSAFRSEPERIGLVIDAAENSASINSLPAEDLAEKLFEMIGLTAKPSNAGLITRQLIVRLGGADGARVFKIPGVRRLIKTYGPTASFTKSAAVQLIGNKDPNNPNAKFSDHENLYIEARPFGTKLTPEMVFAYLVEKGVFRIGAELVCPTCRLRSWIALDTLGQRNVCDLCGGHYDATRQLVAGTFAYRRSGVLGLERNAQGAVPVALTLQQFAINIDVLHHDKVLLPSYDLTPSAGASLPRCETDIFAIFPCDDGQKTQILIGECKDEGGVIDAKDVENLFRVADAFPRHRFEVFILFAKLGTFSAREITLARTGNGQYQQRVILLTARELEPYHLYERTKKELGIEGRGSSLDEIARVTSQIYFDLHDARMSVLRQISRFGERADLAKS